MKTWGRLTDLINNGKALTLQDTLFFVFSLNEIQQFAIRLNTGSRTDTEYGQLFLHGIDSTGKELSAIGGGYSDFTVEVKKETGLPFDRITLYQTGDFYKSWDFVQKKDGFVLSANTIKDGQDLLDDWGKNIIGLTDESIKKLGIKMLPEVINYIVQQLLQ